MQPTEKILTDSQQNATHQAAKNGHHVNGSAPRPDALQVLAENIPDELKQLQQWVTWRFSWDGKTSRWTKVPTILGTKARASSTNKRTWSSFAISMNAHHNGGVADGATDGIGFVVRAQDKYTGVDLDGCINLTTGVIEPAALAIVEHLDSYTELSPSGTGLRIIIRGKLPRDENGKTRSRCAASWKRGDEKAEIEIYDTARYLTMTGHHWSGTPRTIESRQKQLSEFHAQLFLVKPPHKKVELTTCTPLSLTDNELLEKAFAAKNGAKIRALYSGGGGAYPSLSEADSALCCHLAFYSRDAAQIDRIWLSSALMRDKSEREDYRQRTIENALETVTEIYTPKKEKFRPIEYRAPQETATEETSEIPTLKLGYPLTDTGNAERFISQFGENFLYSKALGFHVWNGTCWAPDETDKVFEWSKKAVRRIYIEAAHADDDDRPKIAAWAKTSESLPRRNALIETVSKDGPKVHPDKFDSNPWLFGVQNGTLDLQTGQLHAPNRADFITKTAPVIYDPSATCPRFIQFLSAILNGDIETAEFLQRFFGYTLTGCTREQCFLILYGGGSNGKSTLLNVLRWLLGSYCKQTKPDTLMQRKFGDGIPNDVAMLRAARAATAIETNEGRQFDEAKIKEMTGGDPVTARFFRKEFFEFVPEFKLYLATNHKPRIIGDDAGIWRRVRLVPFNVHFWNPDKQGESGPEHLRADKTLGDALRDELPGILNWALEGCLNWQRDGLPEPKSVADATAEYRTESDPLETFLSERCFCAEHCETPNAQLYKEFSEWAQREDENELSQKAFTARMRIKGFENTRGTGGLRKWKGVGLLEMGTR